jgi:pimeloyl-ACP methyl ester carboxylesterase
MFKRRSHHPAGNRPARHDRKVTALPATVTGSTTAAIRSDRFTRHKMLGVTLAASAVAGLLIPASQIASAQTAARTSAASGPKATIVLEHGAWADSGSWDAVIARLQRDGYTVYAPPNPLQGLTYDSAFLADFLHSVSGPIVLVGHSYGGDVITAPHLSMISNPGAVTQVILQAVHATT